MSAPIAEQLEKITEDQKDYGKILAGNILEYKDKCYEIKHVGDGFLFLETHELFGTDGDEFPLDLIR